MFAFASSLPAEVHRVARAVDDREVDVVALQRGDARVRLRLGLDPGALLDRLREALDVREARLCGAELDRRRVDADPELRRLRRTRRSSSAASTRRVLVTIDPLLRVDPTLQARRGRRPWPSRDSTRRTRLSACRACRRRCRDRRATRADCRRAPRARRACPCRAPSRRGPSSIRRF